MQARAQTGPRRTEPEKGGRRASPLGPQVPRAVTVSEGGPGAAERSPPTSSAPWSAAPARTPSIQPFSSRSSRSAGARTARSKARARAAVAARSDRARPAALRPTLRAGVPASKCTPSMQASTQVTLRVPAGSGRSTAASWTWEPATVLGFPARPSQRWSRSSLQPLTGRPRTSSEPVPAPGTPVPRSTPTAIRRSAAARRPLRCPRARPRPAFGRRSDR